MAMRAISTLVNIELPYITASDIGVTSQNELDYFKQRNVSADTVSEDQPSLILSTKDPKNVEAYKKLLKKHVLLNEIDLPF